MRTKESLLKEIRILMRELAKASFNLRMEKRGDRQIALHHVRTEIYKSICHRQGLVIQALTAEVEFGSERKVA